MTFFRLAVLGDPVEHSLSPVIHSAGLAAAGLQGSYTARTVTRAGMEAAVDDVRCGRLTGANVTMPFKQDAARLADELAPEVVVAGVANTLVHRGGRVVAYNTDVSGMQRAWSWANLPDDAPSLILGAGGAAVAAVLARRNSRTALSARRPEAAAALVERLGMPVDTVPWGEPKPGYVVVNATPLGMKGEELPPEILDRAAGLFDMAYGSGTTPAVRHAAELGLGVAAGPDMLLGQAIEGFEIWTGVAAPVDAMRAAMTTERQRRGH